MVLEYEDYVQRFADFEYVVKSSKEEYEADLAEQKRLKKNVCNVKFTIIGACCSKEFKTTWGGFDKREIKRCNKCANKALSIKIRETYQEIVDKFAVLGATLLTTEEEYEKHLELGLSRFLFKIIAKCGHERNTKYDNYRLGCEKAGVCINCSAKQKYDINLPYSDIKEKLEEAGCELMTAEENFKNIFFDIEFKAACGHTGTEIFNNIDFKKNKTNCAACRTEKASSNRASAIDEETGRLNVLLVEDEAANWIKELVKDKFDIIYTEEGCKADMAFKPKEIIEDKWAMIQLKAASKPMNDSKTMFGYNLNNDYSGMIMVFTAKSANSLWIMDGKDVKDLSGINLSLYEKSKYFEYKVPIKYFVNDLYDLYFEDKFDKKPIEKIMKRTFKSGLNEDIYKEMRITKITCLKFEKVINYSVTDFIVNGFKVQEKLAQKNHQMYNCQLHKSKGRNIKIPYEKGDNDFYWIHLDDWKLFYIIPEQVLIDHGHITENDKIGNKNMSIYPKKYNKLPKQNAWIEEYVFEYENLEEDKLNYMFNIDN